MCRSKAEKCDGVVSIKEKKIYVLNNSELVKKYLAERRETNPERGLRETEFMIRLMEKKKWSKHEIGQCFRFVQAGAGIQPENTFEFLWLNADRIKRLASEFYKTVDPGAEAEFSREVYAKFAARYPDVETQRAKLREIRHRFSDLLGGYSSHLGFVERGVLWAWHKQEILTECHAN